MLSTIRKEIEIDALPEQVWDAEFNIGAVHYRLDTIPAYAKGGER